MSIVKELIDYLKLEPHPKEGGFFRETYRSEEKLAAAALPGRYGSARSMSTAIYYMLTAESYSALHRLASDEVFHFYLGDPVRMLQLTPDGQGQIVVLGANVLGGQQLQVVVPRGTWQGSRLEPGGRFALLGCTVAPGFDYADYETGKRAELVSQYPEFTELIHNLTPVRE